MGEKILNAPVLCLTLFISFTMVYAEEIKKEDDSLIARWDFDEGKGDTAKDAGPNHLDGRIHGAKWIEGKTGSALEFDGMDDYVEIPDSKNLNVTGAISIEAWIKPMDFLAGKQSIIDKSCDGKGKDSFLFMLYGNDLQACIYQVSENYCYSGLDALASGWQHVAFTFDGNKVNLFQNGGNVLSSKAYAPLTASEFTILIGKRRFPEEPEYFLGCIDEVRIYNRALIEDEMKAHYKLK